MTEPVVSAVAAAGDDTTTRSTNSSIIQSTNDNTTDTTNNNIVITTTKTAVSATSSSDDTVNGKEQLIDDKQIPTTIANTEDDNNNNKIDSTNNDNTNDPLDSIALSSSSSFPTTTNPLTIVDSISNKAIASLTMETKITTTKQLPGKATKVRKEELLLQAREERIRWIYSKPVPYDYNKMNLITTRLSSAISTTNNNNDSTTKDIRVETFQSSYICSTFLPSATSVLNALYNTTTTEGSSNIIIPTTILGDHIEEILGESLQKDKEYALPTGQQILLSELVSKQRQSSCIDTNKSNTNPDNTNTLVSLSASTSSDIVLNEYNILRSYQQLLLQLQDPIYLSFVQSIRSFCTTLQYNKDDDDINSLPIKIQSYFQVTYDNYIKQKTNPKTTNNTTTSTTSSSSLLQFNNTIGMNPSTVTTTMNSKANDTTTTVLTDDQLAMIRRSLESLVYGHCYESIYKIVYTDDDRTKEQDWITKLQHLEFIRPKHLEIQCLHDDTNAPDQYEQLLQEPIQQLLSIDAYYSVYEKLYRILALYRSVNVALSNALNPSSSSTAGGTRKLPSADDVLPFIILTVLKGRPANILYNLKIIELFCSAEALRGEAGYAFTNLYGAVQFVLGINTSTSTSDTDISTTLSTSHLSITVEEYKSELERCKQAMTAKQTQLTSAIQSLPKDNEHDLQVELLGGASQIPPYEIRLARLRGEVVDVDWAIRWYQKQQPNKTIFGGQYYNDDVDNSNVNTATTEVLSSPTHNTDPPNTLSIAESFDETLQIAPSSDLPVTPTASNVAGPTSASSVTNGGGLPAGFQRNYTFLTTRPEDIRISDLPQLLDEYRMLVRTTELLLYEKAAAIKQAQRDKAAAIEKQFFETVQQIDPSLLPTTSNTTNSTSNK